jgi:hypothetical protein
MPKDIEHEIPQKDLGKDEGSPKVDRPLSPIAPEDIPEAVKPPNLIVDEETPEAGKEDRPKSSSPSLRPQVEDLGVTAKAPVRESSA